MERKIIHEKYMERCLQLAALGLADVAPNPMVGAALVYDDKIIGEGYHMQYGGPHAEVNCINSVAKENIHLIAASTLYVSLEPCNHFGNTPPCTDLIISNKIKKVVIGCSDPYEKVNGSGIETLRSAGIEVVENILFEKATLLNKRFFTFHQQQRPYIILKWAQSKNGFIAEKNAATKISNEISDQIVHQWRSEESAILVGTKTALTDNPSLTTRLAEGKNAVRIVIDKQLSVPGNYSLLNDPYPSIIINTKIQKEENNKTYYKVGEDENLVAVIINLMHQRKLISLIVEGGADTLQRFIDAGLWDEARIIINNDLELNDGIKSPVLISQKLISTKIFLNDTIEYREHVHD